MSRKAQKTRRRSTHTQPNRVRWLERAWQSLARRRKVILVAVVCATVLLLPFLALRPGVAAVDGSIAAIDRLTVTYDSGQTDGVSPVSGGLLDKPAFDEWRGITFMSRAFRIGLSSEATMCAYLISSAAPADATWRPGGFLRFKPLVYRVWVPQGEVFSAASLVDGHWPKTWTVEQAGSNGYVNFVEIGSAHDLNVEVPNQAPMNAWLPMRKSSVSIFRQRTVHGDGQNPLELTEDFGPDHAYRAGYEFPIVDSLGPNVVYWSDDSEAVAVSDEQLFLPAVAPEGYAGTGTCVLAVVVPHPPFASRAAMIPLTAASWQGHLQDQLTFGPDAKGDLRPLRSLGPNGESDIGFLFRDRPAGSARLSLLDTETPAALFASARRALATTAPVSIQPVSMLETDVPAWLDVEPIDTPDTLRRVANSAFRWAFGGFFRTTGAVSNDPPTDSESSHELAQNLRRQGVEASESVQLSSAYSASAPDGAERLLSDPVAMDGTAKALMSMHSARATQTSQVDSTLGFMSFRNPPLPDTLGISVYGRPSRVTASGASGLLMLDEQSVRLNPSQELSLIRPHPTSSMQSLLSFPYPGTAAVGTGTVLGQCNAAVLVGGQPFKRALDARGVVDFAQVYGVWIALLGLLVAVVATFRPRPSS